MQLRPYQQEAVDAVRAAYRRRQRAALLVMATGTGKTFTALSMVTGAMERGNRVLWLAHRRELLEQPLETMRAVPGWGDLAQRGGIVQADRNEADAGVVFASIATVGKPDGARLAEIVAHGQPDLIVVDEAHHSTSASWQRALSALGVGKEGGPWLLGLTATPERTDRADLSALWGDAPVYSYAIQDAIADGYLMEPTFIVEQIEGEVLEAIRGNADSDDIARQLMEAGIVGHTVEQMGRHLRGRSVLVFTANVAQAKATADALNSDGWRAVVVSGETPTVQRGQIVRAFKRGEIDAICNCAVFTEGTDLPRCDAIVAARPFTSKPLWIQAVGRCLRLYPGKSDALVLDLAAASVEHGVLHAAGLLSVEEGEGTGQAQPQNYEALRPILLRGEWVPKGGEVKGIRGEAPGVVIPVKDENLRLTLGRDVKGGARDVYGGMARKRAPVRAAWVRLEGLNRPVYTVDIADHGGIYVVEEDDDLWQAYHVKKGGRVPRALALKPTSLGLAQGLGDDLFRQAQGLVRQQAAWRDRAPSGKQVAYASRLGIDIPRGTTAGHVAELITATKGRDRAIRLGLAGAA